MTRVKLGKEVVIRMPNEIGLLSQIAKLIAEKGINVLAISGWTEGSTAVIHAVTSDNLRTADALRGAGLDPIEQDAVLLEVDNKPGMLRKVTERLAGEGINLNHLYAAALADREAVLMVFSSTNNARVLQYFPT
ncbi:MAG: ACT domain-containing protein [Kiritimatiellae bacterium]|nr:ACT domain-containing protein [Kiritimatiellia bacterium]